MYHLSVKPISRSAGRSATAAAAYRAGEEIVDERTGEVHDYTRKGGVEHAEIVLPAGSPGWAADRAALWNAAEAAEKRKDARVAREYEVALPKELSRAQGIELMRDFAADLVERYGVAVDFAIHRDHREKWDGSEKGFDAFHAHVLTSTRQMGRDGFGEKASPELSDAKRRSLGLGEGAKEVERTRERWEIVANRHLEMAGESQRIDRRSLKEQGIDREPTRHLGPIVTALERRGIQTDTGDVNRRIEAAYLQGVRERAELAALRPQVLDLSSSIEQALMVRDGLKVREQIEGRRQERLREKPAAKSARSAAPPGPLGALSTSQGDGLKPGAPGAEGAGSGGRQDSPGRNQGPPGDSPGGPVGELSAEIRQGVRAQWAQFKEQFEVQKREADKKAKLEQDKAREELQRKRDRGMDGPSR